MTDHSSSPDIASALRKALETAYHELKKHDADYHYRTPVSVNGMIVDALASDAAQPAPIAHAIKLIRAEPCPFREGPMADAWAEAWATFLNRLGDVDGTSELYASSTPSSIPSTDLGGGK